MSQPGETSAKRPRRRWYQYSLRTLLGVMTLAVAVLVSWRTYVERYYRQKQTMQLIEQLGGSYQTVEAPKWLARLFGADFQDITVVNLADCDKPDEYLDAIVTLPALETLVVGGRSFTDEHLNRFADLTTLRGLVLDSTSVSDEALVLYQRRFPSLELYPSQRRLLRSGQIVGATEYRRGSWLFNLFRANGHHPPAAFSYVTVPSETHDRLSNVVGKEYFEEVREAATSRRIADDELTELVKWRQHLRNLVLRDALMSDAGLNSILRQLAHLQRLDLSGTTVSDDGLGHLRELNHLTHLDLAGTRVGDAGLVQVASVLTLTNLDLIGTQVTDAGLPHLRPLTNLRNLYLAGTRVTSDGVAQLRRDLPDCFVGGP